MNLSKRLSAIKDMVPYNSIVADIGTDHCYIPINLVENKISKKVIATDISKDSLDKTMELVKSLGLEGKIEVRLGNGLDVIKPYEIDTVILAGMGGVLIQDILEKNKDVTDSISNFIFQPMKGVKEFREHLTQHDFQIVDEGLVFEEEKYYEIIFAKRGKSCIEKDIYYEISQLLLEKQHPLMEDFILNKIQETKFILDKIKFSNTEKSKEKYLEVEEKLKDYKEVLLKIES